MKDTGEHIKEIDEKIYPLIHSGQVGEYIGYYRFDSSQSKTEQALQASHNLLYALNILKDDVTSDNAKTMRDAIFKLEESLHILTDNMSELDQDIVKEIKAFFDDTNNSDFINAALDGNPMLSNMKVTHNEIKKMKDVVCKNCDELQKTQDVLLLARLYREENVSDDLFDNLKNNFGVSDEAINNWKGNIENDPSGTKKQIKEKIKEIGYSEHGETMTHIALFDQDTKTLNERGENTVRLNKIGLTTEYKKPNIQKRIQMLYEKFKINLAITFKTIKFQNLEIKDVSEKKDQKKSTNTRSILSSMESDSVRNEKEAEKRQKAEPATSSATNKTALQTWVEKHLHINLPSRHPAEEDSEKISRSSRK